MACAQGALAKLAVKEASGDITWSTGTVIPIPFARESLQKRAHIGHPDVIIGSREEVSERARFAPYFYGGWIVFHLSPGHAATVFPWALGADADGSTPPFYDLAESLQTFGVLVDKVTGVHEFYDGVINRMIISGKQNGPGGPPNFITCAIQCIFKGYNGPSTADSYPSLTYGITGEYKPLVFEDTDNAGTSRLTLNAATREMKSFTLDINNHVEPRYVNSLTPTALCPTRRTITLTTVHPYDSGTSSLYDQAVAGAGGSLNIVNGTVSVAFTFGNVQADVITPVVDGKHEINLQMQMSIRKVSTTASLRVAVDSTP